MKKNCANDYFDYTSKCVKNRLYRYENSSFQHQFREMVSGCFNIHNCLEPVFSGVVLANATKTRLNNTLNANTKNLQCFNRNLHDSATKLISECHKVSTAKDLGDVPTLEPDNDRRYQDIMDAIDMAHAIDKCPAALKPAIKACITASMPIVQSRVCADTAICYNILKYRTCYGDYKIWKSQVCACNANVRALKPTRELQQADRPTLLDIDDALTGLVGLLRGGAAASNPVGGGTLGKIQSNLAEKQKIEHLKTYGARYGLTPEETVDSLKKCLDPTGKPLEPQALRPSYEDMMLAACGCSTNGLAGGKVACLSGPGCLGTKNYALFLDAMSSFTLHDKSDPMGYFCGCGDAF